MSKWVPPQVKVKEYGFIVPYLAQKVKEVPIMPNTCTVHRPNGRYHILFEDLRLIAADDIVNASVLRVLEQKTDKRIELLRDHYDIPDDQLPPDDLLWIDEEDASLRELERWSIGVRRKSSFARALKDQNPEKLPASLIQLGLVKRRWIARRNDRAWPICTHADVQRDAHGPFLIVAEGNGDYYVNGGKHNAAMEGYSEISRQFLYCFEKINKVIAALDGYDPPEPLKRWQKEAPSEGTHRNMAVSSDGAQENTRAATTPGGYSFSSAGSHVFSPENTTNQGNTSIIGSSEGCPILDGVDQNWTPPSKNAQPRPTEPNSVSKKQRPINKNPLSNLSNSINPKKDSAFLVSQGLTIEGLRAAPRTTQTWLGLLSTILDVPDPSTCDPEVWERDWQQGIQRLLAATSSLSDALAWERSGVTAAYMTDPDSLSWWVQGRATQSPVTARHVADNYLVQWKDCNAKQWRPLELVAYDGPPLEYVEYQAGYKAKESAAAPEPPIIVEEPPALPVVEETPPALPQGMKRRTAERMRDRIWQEYPTLFLSLLSLSEDRYAVSIQIGEDMWHDLMSSADWYQPTEATQTSLAQALHFSAERDAIPTEVGAVEEPEPPIILADTPDNDAADEETYVSMEEIGEELQRGLRPLGSSPMAEVAPVVVEKSLPVQNEPYEPVAPQGKAGMSLMIAQLLLAQIESAGYNAQLRPISDDRAMLTVEVSPGHWIDVDSSASWQRHLKSVAQSPPTGSVASVITMSGMTQPMEVAQ